MCWTTEKGEKGEKDEEVEKEEEEDAAAAALQIIITKEVKQSFQEKE